jgi:hypothetical protein
VPSIWIDMAVGVGIATGTDPIATDPDIEIDWSDDGGQTFSTPRLRKIGRQSEGKTRVRVNQCGRSGSQGRIIRVKQSSPVHFGLMGGRWLRSLRRMSFQSATRMTNGSTRTARRRCSALSG